MGVKKLLAEYDNAFMSLHEVLYRMTTIDNASYQEAAQLLSKLLRDPTKIIPAWYRISPKDPKTLLVDILIKEAFRCLDQAVWYGIAPERPESEEDQREFQEYNGNLKTFDEYCKYGFDRTEISNFLKSVDIDIEASTYPIECLKSPFGIPDVAPRLSNPNTALTEQLTECLNENARLKQEAYINQSLSKQFEDSRLEIDRMISAIKELREKLAEVTAERDSLKKQILSGGGNNKCLELLGTLAIYGYGMNIHAKKINGINEKVQDMNLLGLSANPKTVSSWLKMAAGKIDRPVDNISPKK